MKKTTAIILTILLTVSLASVAVSADNGYTTIDVPKADVSPTIDGTISEGEWDGATVFVLNADSGQSLAGFDAPGDFETTYHFIYCDNGLYMAAQVRNAFENPLYPSGDPDTAMNANDVVQLAILPSGSRATTENPLYFFDLALDAEGNGLAYLHFIINATPEGVVVEGQRDGTSWDLEVFIPWETLRLEGEDFVVEGGLTMPFQVTSLAYDIVSEESKFLITAADWNYENYFDLRLQAAETEEPATEEPATEEPATEEPATEEPTTEEPGDAGTVGLAALGMISALAGALAVSKKRK